VVQGQRPVSRSWVIEAQSNRAEHKRRHGHLRHVDRSPVPGRSAPESTHGRSKIWFAGARRKSLGVTAAPPAALATDSSLFQSPGLRRRRRTDGLKMRRLGSRRRRRFETSHDILCMVQDFACYSCRTYPEGNMSDIRLVFQPSPLGGRKRFEMPWEEAAQIRSRCAERGVQHDRSANRRSIKPSSKWRLTWLSR